jgi:hypothetical protein
MAEQDDLKDIGRTIASAGTLFLFSCLYLKSGHADMLAERLDGGPQTDP